MPEVASLFPRWWRQRCAFAALVLATTAAPSFAVNYGDISVVVDDEPQNKSTHGYAEIWFRIDNRSQTATHDVKLNLPKASYAYGGDHLRSVSRTVTLEPQKSVRVYLSYPEKQTLEGSGVAVSIDGAEQEEILGIRLGGSSSSYSRSYGSFSRTVYTTAEPAFLLFSNSVDSHFKDLLESLSHRIQSGDIAVPENTQMPGGPGSKSVQISGSSIRGITVNTSKLPPALWSPNWLGYSRYDGIVLADKDLRAMPADVRAALGQYVECGGTLLLLGGDVAMLGPWKLAPVGKLPIQGCAAGYGHCFVTMQKDYTSMEPSALAVVTYSWNRTADPWSRTKTTVEANRTFPVVDDLGVPVWPLLFLMVVFAIVIGPVNLFVLARWKKKLWLFWTVPLISFLTCLAVLGSVLLLEGWSSRVRVAAFTVLDENSRRASTLGVSAVYTPLLPGGGMHFSTETEVNYQNKDESEYYRRRGGSPLSIDWSRDQHLASGWVTPRVPSHFVLRKGETRRERVTVTVGSDGRPEAVNGLGADITEFWYANESGALFTAQRIPAGGKASLTPSNRKPSDTLTLRSLYMGDWFDITERLKKTGPDYLTPRTYLAYLDAAPFLDDGVPKSGSARAKSIVFGVLKSEE